jgi:soluble lytic murein transglycosylase-like protein
MQNFAEMQMRAYVLVALLAGWTPWASAADIYASVSADGTTRWATQALDDSYKKVMAEPAPVLPLNSRPPSSLYPAKQNPALQARRTALASLIEQTAARHGIDAQMLMALVEVESAFNTQAISPKGARGLMQLMPATALRYGMRQVRELHDPARNLDMGARHLKDLLALHDGQWALVMASYNAGHGAVAKHGQRIPRYTETMLYVPAVLSKAAHNTAARE